MSQIRSTVSVSIQNNSQCSHEDGQCHGQCINIAKKWVITKQGWRHLKCKTAEKLIAWSPHIEVKFTGWRLIGGEIKRFTYIRKRDHGTNLSVHSNMDLEDYSRITSMDDAGFIDISAGSWTAARRLQCNSCNRPFSQVREKRAIVCGYILRCAGCKTKKKMTTDTILEGACLPMRKFFGILYMWAYMVSVTQATALLVVSSQTLVQWYQYLR